MLDYNDKLRIKGSKLADDIILNNNIEPLTVGSPVPYKDHSLAATLGLGSQIHNLEDSILLFKAKIVEVANENIDLNRLDPNQKSLIMEGLTTSVSHYLMRENFDIHGQKELVDSMEDCDVEFDSSIHGRVNFLEAHRIILGNQDANKAPGLSI
jgi:hypothetical protein